MMARAFKCDRCGELYSAPDTSVKITDGGHFFSCICYGNRTWLSDTKDLCPNCARDFLVWWEHSNISAQYELQRIKDDLRANAEFAAHNVVKTYTKENDI